MRFSNVLPIDDYVIEILMPDLVGHDRHPAAYLVYLHLYRRAYLSRWARVTASLRTIAEATGLSKTAVQTAVERLQRRQLINAQRSYRTATPRHEVLRPWRDRTQQKKKRGQNRSR